MRFWLLGIGATLGLVGLGFLAMSVAFPEQAANIGLGTNSLREAISREGQRITATTTIRPVLDVLLLLGSYAAVCGLLWVQEWLSQTIKHRRHFK